MELDAFRAGLAELPLHECWMQEWFVRHFLPPPSQLRLPAPPSFPEAPDFDSDHGFFVMRRVNMWKEKHGVTPYESRRAWQSYREETAKVEAVNETHRNNKAVIEATGIELERRFARPMGADTTTLRRAFTLNWWYFVYGMSFVQRPPGTAPQASLAVVRATIMKGWDELMFGTRGSLPALDAVRTNRRQGSVADDSAVEASVTRLHRLYGSYKDLRDVSQATVLRRILELWPQEAVPSRMKVSMNDYRFLPLNAIDPKLLEKRWEDARKELELSMRGGELPSSQFVYDPRLDVFKARILQEQLWLKEPDVQEECRAFIRKMHGNYGAALMAYEFLKSALMLGGDSYVAAEVAELELEYIEGQSRRELGEAPSRPERRVRDRVDEIWLDSDPE